MRQLFKDILETNVYINVMTRKTITHHNANTKLWLFIFIINIIIVFAVLLSTSFDFPSFPIQLLLNNLDLYDYGETDVWY